VNGVAPSFVEVAAPILLHEVVTGALSTPGVSDLTFPQCSHPLLITPDGHSIIRISTGCEANYLVL